MTPRAIDRVVGATTRDVGAPHDVCLAAGRVVAERSAIDTERCLHVAGRVVVPAFVDAHLHLDKAYLVGHPLLADGFPPGLGGAIATVAGLRDVLSLDDVATAARRAVDALVGNGTTAARVHVEIDPAIGLDFVGLHQRLANAVADRCTLQLVAFPQRGLELAGAADLLAAAMAEGLTVVGGCPYVDDDPARHLDLVFALAERHGAPVDLHLDFGDDPGRSLLGLVAERTKAHGLQGRVTVGHVTTLAAMDASARAAALDLLAGLDIALVVLPATDLHLAGAGDPGTRSLAPLHEAVAAGVRTAIANNNIANPFSPFGNADLTMAAWLAGVITRSATEADQQRLLDAITTMPASILGLPGHGPSVGAVADLAVLDTVDPTMVVRGAPRVVATVKAGRLAHLVEPPTVTDRW